MTSVVIRDISIQHKETKYYCEDGQTPKQVAQGGSIITILGDTLNILNIFHQMDEI